MRLYLLRCCVPDAAHCVAGVIRRWFGLPADMIYRRPVPDPLPAPFADYHCYAPFPLRFARIYHCLCLTALPCHTRAPFNIRHRHGSHTTQRVSQRYGPVGYYWFVITAATQRWFTYSLVLYYYYYSSLPFPSGLCIPSHHIHSPHMLFPSHYTFPSPFHHSFPHYTCPE